MATTCHITTFNCGREPVHVDYFASSLYSTLTNLPPDLIVLALQEIAPLGPSFVGGSLLTPYLTHLSDSVTRATQWKFGENADYETVLVRNVGMTAIMLFAQKDVKDRIEGVEEAGTGVGVWDMGNKGAVGVRLGLKKEVLTFVSAHLAPMEEKWEKRNEDWKTICQTLVFEPVENGKKVDRGVGGSEAEQPLLGDSTSANAVSGLFEMPGAIFFAGDLNYRTSDTKPELHTSESWPQPSTSDATLTEYFAKDQLTREKNKNETLHNLREAPVTFPPTYKYSTAAQKVAAEIAAQQVSRSRESDVPGIDFASYPEKSWLWAKHRVPSWCDRILFLEACPPEVHAYTALPVQPTSDHRPVSLSFTYKYSASKADHVKPPFSLDRDWKARRATARQREIVIGLGAYLGLTGQGQVLLGGTTIGVVLGYFALKYLLES